MAVPKLQSPGEAAHGLLHHRTSETGTACPIYCPATCDSLEADSFPQYINGQMHEDHDVSHGAQRKDTLSAEDLGILLQWFWKYGTSTFANERQQV